MEPSKEKVKSSFASNDSANSDGNSFARRSTEAAKQAKAENEETSGSTSDRTPGVTYESNVDASTVKGSRDTSSAARRSQKAKAADASLAIRNRHRVLTKRSEGLSTIEPSKEKVKASFASNDSTNTDGNTFVRRSTEAAKQAKAEHEETSGSTSDTTPGVTYESNVDASQTSFTDDNSAPTNLQNPSEIKRYPKQTTPIVVVADGHVVTVVSDEQTTPIVVVADGPVFMVVSDENVSLVKKWYRKRHIQILILIAFVVTIVLVVVVMVNRAASSPVPVTSLQPSSSLRPSFSPTASAIPSDPPTSAPSPLPTGAPTLAPSNSPTEERRSLIVERLLAEGVAFDLAELNNSTCVVGEAFHWLVYDDEYRIDPSDVHLVQRFVLAVIYFASGGESWNRISKSDGVWLSNRSECEWFVVISDLQYGVLGCTADDTVIKLDFRKLISCITYDYFLSFCLFIAMPCLLLLLSFLAEDCNLSGPIPRALLLLRDLRTFFIFLGEFNLISRSLTPTGCHL